ncbi:MAG TPA: hypothetical protein VGE00_10405 [Gammaproteobacteria bacterium]
MTSKRNAQPLGPDLHAITTYREEEPRSVRQYWPILLFILVSALSQIMGGLFSA